MKKKNGLKVWIVILAIALAAVIGIIVWKQWDYGVSADFYGGLRGAEALMGAAV